MTNITVLEEHDKLDLTLARLDKAGLEPRKSGGQMRATCVVYGEQRSLLVRRRPNNLEVRVSCDFGCASDLIDAAIASIEIDAVDPLTAQNGSDVVGVVKLAASHPAPVPAVPAAPDAPDDLPAVAPELDLLPLRQALPDPSSRPRMDLEDGRWLRLRTPVRRTG